MQWLFRRKQRYDDLAISIEEHLQERTEELIGEGVPRDEAAKRARREFGNLTQVEERGREVWQWPALESFWADMRFALRQLAKAPGFAVTAVTTLALGIALNATMFSLVSAFLLAPLPGRDPQNVVVVSSVRPDAGERADINSVSAPNYLAWRTDKRVFADMAAADEYRTGSLTGQGLRPESVRYAAVSANYFQLFAVAPELGRAFASGEDSAGRAHVAILSDGLWAGRFASDPAIVGRVIRLNREDYVVAGVMPADFRLLGFAPQLWTPLVLSAADQTAVARKERLLYLFARLAPGVTLAGARAELAVLAQRAEKEWPLVELHWGASARTLPDFVVYNFGIRSALTVMMTAVGFVLLIACANVAGLLLTRAARRQKELAIRVSVGASRLRIVRQLVTEGLLIALLGESTGLLLTYLGISVMRANLHFNEAISAVPLRLDRNVLLFVAAVSVLSAVLSSILPALRSARTDVNTDLKSESRTASASLSHGRLRTVLVAGEITLALFLLTGTSLLIRGIFLLDHQQLGFPTDHLLTAHLELDAARYPDGSRQVKFVRDLISRMQTIPGVRETAIVSDLPATNPEQFPLIIQGDRERAANEQRSAIDAVVTSDYFRVAAIPLVRGRAFFETDSANTRRVVLVNEEFARRYLQGKDALGIQIRLEFKDAAPGWSVIVGVVRNVKSFSEEARVDPEVYEVFAQRPVPSFSALLRTAVEPSTLIPALRKTVAQLDPELPLSDVMSMDAVIDHQRNGNPLFTRIMGTFALLALGLAAIGIYGLVAYSVSQRTHEIGIRMALGAKAADILGMILKTGLRTAIMGAALGLVLTLPLPKIFGAAFQGVHFEAPALHGIACATILMVAGLATFIPAWRASRLDAKTVLRSE